MPVAVQSGNVGVSTIVSLAILSLSAPLSVYWLCATATLLRGLRMG